MLHGSARLEPKSTQERIYVDNYIQAIQEHYLYYIQKIYYYHKTKLNTNISIIIIGVAEPLQLIFLLSVLPKPPLPKRISERKLMYCLTYSFIWNEESDKISRHVIIGNYSQRGLKMLSLPSLITGSIIAWVKWFIMWTIQENENIFFEY